MTLGLLVLLLASVVVLTGCTVGVGLDTKVETDGSGTVSVRFSGDKALDDALSEASKPPEDTGSFLDDLGESLGLDDLGQALGGMGKILEGLGKLGGALGGLSDLGGALGGLGDLGGGLGDLGQASGLIPGSVDELFNTIMGQMPGDWKVERGTDSDGTKWVAMTRPFADPQELKEILASSALSSIVNVDTLELTQDSGVFGTKTRFSTTADVGGSLSQLTESIPGLSPELIGQSLVIENRLTLPGTIGDNNADEVQGNTLIWNIGIGDSRELYAESMTYNWAAIVGIIIAGGIIIAALVVVVVLLSCAADVRWRLQAGPPVEGAYDRGRQQSTGRGRARSSTAGRGRRCPTGRCPAGRGCGRSRRGPPTAVRPPEAARTS